MFSALGQAVRLPPLSERGLEQMLPPGLRSVEPELRFLVGIRVYYPRKKGWLGNVSVPVKTVIVIRRACRLFRSLILFFDPFT